MASYNELVTHIKADNKDFKKKIDESISAASKFSKDILKYGGIAATAIGVTAVGGFAALLHIINETTDQVSELVDMSHRLGSSVGGLQKLQYAASLSGVSAGQLESGMTKLARSMMSAGDESSSVSKALKELGLSSKDLATLGLDEQYIKVAESLEKVGDKAKQNEIAFTLFGRSGLTQLGFIRDGITQALGEFDKLGGALTDQQASEIDTYGDSITKLKATFGAFAMQMTAAVAPALVEFIKYIQESIISAGGLGQLGKTVGLFLVDGIILAVKAFQTLLNMIANVKLEFMKTKLVALELIQALSNTKFAVTGGDFNFNRSMDIAQLTRDIATAKKQSTDVTSGLLKGLDNAKNAVSSTQTSQKVEVVVSAAPDFMIQVSQSNTVNSAIRQAIYSLTGSEAGSTVASGG